MKTNKTSENTHSTELNIPKEWAEALSNERPEGCFTITELMQLIHPSISRSATHRRIKKLVTLKRASVISQVYQGTMTHFYKLK
jgi:hypothetical protein